jgi:hypothetical protein
MTNVKIFLSTDSHQRLIRDDFYHRRERLIKINLMTLLIAMSHSSSFIPQNVAVAISFQFVGSSTDDHIRDLRTFDQISGFIFLW